MCETNHTWRHYRTFKTFCHVFFEEANIHQRVCPILINQFLNTIFLHILTTSSYIFIPVPNAISWSFFSVMDNTSTKFSVIFLYFQVQYLYNCLR